MVQNEFLVLWVPGSQTLIGLLKALKAPRRKALPEIFSKIIVCSLPLPNCRQQLFLSFRKPHDFLFCHLRRSSLDFSCRLLSPLLCKYNVYYVPETWFSSSKLSPDIHRASQKNGASFDLYQDLNVYVCMYVKISDGFISIMPHFSFLTRCS